MIRRRGFTLVELLITVAIIGVLSTVGIPTYRRMVQKSKRAEAKVLLAAIYKTEASFFSEFAAYGNNLAAMGYEVPTPEYYSAGFSGGLGCNDLPALEPSPLSPLYAGIMQKAPYYYDTTTAKTMFLAKRYGILPGYCSRGEIGDQPNMAITSGIMEPCATTGLICAGVCYVVGATGLLNSSDTLGFGPRDIWYIDNERKLTHHCDGSY